MSQNIIISPYSLKPLSISLLIILMMVSKSTCVPNYLGRSCSNTTMFANNSQYETNLNTLFRYLSSNATNPTGYYRAVSSSGATTSNTIYGHFLCRGDQNTSSCQDCVTNATTIGLPRTYCPNRERAIIWYDECMVRYSNNSFFDRMAISPQLLYWSARNISTSRNVSASFRARLNNLLNELAARAAGGGSQKKFATGLVSSTSNNNQTIYGLAQCTPDLTSDDCNLCLDENGIGQFRATVGGRLYKPSCFLRYEVYAFFDLSSLPPSPQPAPGTNSTRPSGESSTSTSTIAIAIVVPIVVLALLISLCTYHFRRNSKAKKYFSLGIRNVFEDLTNAESLMFELGTLQAATSNFSDDHKLGGGAFGKVYKGTLMNGQEIAVKRLTRFSDHGMESFKNEAVLIAKLQHKNLVRLLGYCSAGEERLLVYEFVPNKSLDYILFDPTKQGELEWPTRYNIITGIARGLLYLHEDSRPRIIHRDLKAPNILLEQDMNPKIADFGLARIFKVEEAEDATSVIAGTYGYMAPEYAMNGQFSVKSDVYSFGVLCLEIISGKKINSRFSAFGEDDLLTYAWRSWKDEKHMEFIDPKLGDSYSTNEVLRCIHLGLLCVQENSNERPTMSTIVFMLNTNSSTNTLPAPRCPRSFYNSNTDSSIITGDSLKSSSNNQLQLSSPNFSLP